MTVTRTRDVHSGRDLQRSLLVNLVACLALVAQFLLGIVVNLFVTIPDQHPGANAPEFFTGIATAILWVIPHGAPMLTAHIVLGLVLVIAGLLNILWAPRMTSRPYTALAFLGAMALLGAAFNGASFLNYGHDFSSMIMSGLWALAMCCYLACLYISARRQITPRRAVRGPSQ